jgi:hypothetical protein
VLAGCGQDHRNSGAVEHSAMNIPETTTLDPNEFLFTTPTLNDALPEESNRPSPADDCFLMHEDDWRQFEFVAAAFGPEMADELAVIDTIWKEHSVPLGEAGTAFRSVHVRTRIPQPLDIPWSVADFEELFGEPACPILLIGSEHPLRDVHAIRLENVVIYGMFADGRLTTLGIEPLDRFVIVGETADRLERFLTEHDLRLVHWRSRTLLESPGAVMQYLRGSGDN